MKRFLRWLRNPEIIGAPDCPIMHRWTIIDSKPATVSPSSNGHPDHAKEHLDRALDGDSFFRHKIVALFELPKRLTRDHKLMVHHFLPNVEDRDPHDHPRSFWTLVLWGRYFDLVPCSHCKGSKVFGRHANGDPNPCPYCEAEGMVVGDVMKAGTVRYRRAEHTHITQSSDRGAWTIVVMRPLERGWGFWRHGSWWPWKKYEKEFGFSMRCPSDEEREGRMLKYADDGEVRVKEGR